MYKYIFSSFLIFTTTISLAQPIKAPKANKPKLVIGLVIDQMRWDFLHKYTEMYGDNGFKRLLRQGFAAENTMIPYTPTYTAPGHTCVYTGSVPAFHGIVGNNWFDRQKGKMVYCTDDSTVTPVGTDDKMGKMSPINMYANTISDELRMSCNFRNKVIGIALKDRGAILPAGHSANAAYWYEGGKWITSSYYMQELPNWVKIFNEQKRVDAYMKGNWTPMYPAEKYTQSTADTKGYENTIKGLTSVAFPHELSQVPEKSKYEAFRTTPYGNTFTLDFAKETILNEALGKSNGTDFLAVSLSSTDYIGHTFGPNSVEIQDTYARLDKDLADFLTFLDKKLGLGNYTLFLTADHGVSHIPGYLNENKMPGATFSDDEYQIKINKKIKEKFNIDNAIAALINYQVYLREELMTDEARFQELCYFVITELKKEPLILQAFMTENIYQATIPEPQRSMTVNGYNSKRSGHIQFTFKPAFFEGGKRGTSHGLWNPYDAHIPCVFFGWGIKPGKTYRETYMTDIAATLASLLKIQMPNACIGKTITEAIK